MSGEFDSVPREEANSTARAEIVQEVITRAEAVGAGELDGASRALVDPFDIQRDAYLTQVLKLRKEYAKAFKWGLAIQLGIADLVFVAYAWVGWSWKIPTPAISVWLGALVVQVVGVVTIIVTGLFPKDDKPDFSPIQRTT